MEFDVSTKKLPNVNVLVDDEDARLFSGRKWSAARLTRGKIYVVRNNKGKIELLHRVILRAEKGKEVDHINGNSLDNRRGNLRECTRTENARNLGKRGKEAYKGINKHGPGWRAHITYLGRTINSKVFSNPEDAAREYDRLAKLYQGEFAKTNAELGLLGG
jgi:hypothetical protein